MASAAQGQTRISIERMEDWNRIRGMFTEAMLSVLNKRIARTSSEHVRDAVTAHLTQWCNDAFDDAKRNIRVDGHNLEDYEAEQEETEPFDEVLDRRIWALSTERVNWQKEVANRRRNIPTEVQRLVEDLLNRQHAAEYVPPPLDDDPEVDGSDARFEHEHEVVEVFNRLRMVGDSLRTTGPQTLERTKRAHEITLEVKKLSS